MRLKARAVICLCFCASVAHAAPPFEPGKIFPKVIDAHGTTLTIDPHKTFQAQNNLQTTIPSNFAGMDVNTFLGANRFYNAGFTGQGATASNIEAGHIWNGHETLGHVTTFTTGSGALGEFDRHATWVGMMIGGRNTIGSTVTYQTGIARGATLRSGAMATNWNGTAFSGSFSISSTGLFDAYQTEFTAADVINSSWGFVDPSGTNFFTVGLDGLARANPRTAFVVSAGNSGPGANTVGAPGAGYNAITVGAVGNANAYDIISTFSSRGPQDYADAGGAGSVSGVRAAVDIVAPGESLTSAYYGGQTGGNGPTLSGSPSGSAGAPNFYSLGVAGTSFAAPIVAGGVALLDSASYNTPALASNPNSRDARVIKSVIMNSATKLAGWNNGQTTSGGVITTSQGLDWAQGAGRLNLNQALDEYISGTKDLAGTGGGTVGRIGWDFGTVNSSSQNDYVINAPLLAGLPFTATLSWFRDRSFVNSSNTTDNAYSDLDLQVWNSTFTTLYAQSISDYNSSELLNFLTPVTGTYGIRVLNTGPRFGSASAENYGLAWAVPEPTAIFLLPVAAIFVARRRRT